jgi:hypothetical protein
MIMMEGLWLLQGEPGPLLSFADDLLSLEERQLALQLQHGQFEIVL